MRAVAACVCATLLSALPVFAETIELKDGTKIDGRIVERSETAITIEIAGNTRLAIPVEHISRIDGVTFTPDWKAVYGSRLKQTDRKDAAALLELAEWCDTVGLANEAAETFRLVLAADPESSAAHKALGHEQYEGKWVDPAEMKAKGLVQHAGKWMTEDEAMKAKGLVKYQGKWMTEEEIAKARAQVTKDCTAALDRFRRSANAAMTTDAKIEAYETLSGADCGESAKLLLEGISAFPIENSKVQRGASKAERELNAFHSAIRIRGAIVRAMGALRSETALEVILGKEGLRNADWEVQTASFEALQMLSAEGNGIGRPAPASEEIRRQVVRSIAEFLKSTDSVLRSHAVRCTGFLGGAQSLQEMKTALEDPSWQVRLAAVEALADAGGEGGIEMLIDRLQMEKGRLVEDMVKALQKLTKADLPVNPDAWKAWWASNKNRKDDKWKNWKSNTTPMFYGMKFYSRRIVFVIDTTGSMLWYHMADDVKKLMDEEKDLKRPPYEGECMLDLAKYELINAIAEMPAESLFTVIGYNSGRISVWEDTPVQATEKNKKRGQKWVESLTAEADTNLYDGLRRAYELFKEGDFHKNFESGPDTVMLFTDGLVNTGSVTETPAILDVMREVHRLTGVRTNTVGVGTFDKALLKGLAGDSGGEYRGFDIRIDEEKEKKRAHGGGGG